MDFISVSERALALKIAMHYTTLDQRSILLLCLVSSMLGRYYFVCAFSFNRKIIMSSAKMRFHTHPILMRISFIRCIPFFVFFQNPGCTFSVGSWYCQKCRFPFQLLLVFCAVCASKMFRQCFYLAWILNGKTEKTVIIPYHTFEFMWAIHIQSHFILE